KERLQALLHNEAYREVEPLMETTYERGKADAYREVEPLMKTTYERGIEQGERLSALRLMEAKFCPLSAEVKQQVEVLSMEALAQLQLDVLKAEALEELGLEN